MSGAHGGQRGKCTEQESKHQHLNKNLPEGDWGRVRDSVGETCSGPEV